VVDGCSGRAEAIRDDVDRNVAEREEQDLPFPVSEIPLGHAPQLIQLLGIAVFGR
jgi:hypothetical protein